ncbi:hydrogenase formation protein HypD [Dasania sp. GY-MA-18]|uniref:Hydrogenase maturation factor n=1 Tax=Dasania phycosphaerae TaxID=2950436 RepID=A0A9J6RNS2_9GAMM|nr:MULTISPECIES: hydrogenase formation protein HypD [Dasania]MCR8923399.1 hydrogenase formation protein HypD [Dasania sp. GY-MA-18]MCZ0865832.1 hydrogenase formation protein HypD [Dasania phycosphaerae]MCZ0869556.1 hydrogenase formation protein HypD [Dasania phycosphaerae]
MRRQSVETLIAGLDAMHPERPFRVMNVCGGHERSITQAGLRSLLDKHIELIPGPGCPVCICPEEDIAQAIHLALNEQVILLSFGDMLRVPVFSHTEGPRSLLAARSQGADVRPVASPLDAVAIARANVTQQVVFFAAGFETTMAPVAAMVAEGVPDNLTVLLSGRLTWPAVAMLLSNDEQAFDALIAPGHVATIMGSDEWAFVAEQHGLPTAIAGFHGESVLAALQCLLQQRSDNRAQLVNCYPEVVKPQGNTQAQQLLREVMVVSAANWRGIGVVEDSGFTLRPEFATVNARVRFSELTDQSSFTPLAPPAGARCADVVLGRLYPDQCPLFGNECTPRHPIGPCMVSDEGACRIWMSSGMRSVDESKPTPEGV